MAEMSRSVCFPKQGKLLTVQSVQDDCADRTTDVVGVDMEQLVVDTWHGSGDYVF
jgi:hypothetical protein